MKSARDIPRWTKPASARNSGLCVVGSRLPPAHSSAQSWGGEKRGSCRPASACMRCMTGRAGVSCSAASDQAAALRQEGGITGANLSASCTSSGPKAPLLPALPLLPAAPPVVAAVDACSSLRLAVTSKAAATSRAPSSAEWRQSSWCSSLAVLLCTMLRSRGSLLALALAQLLLPALLLLLLLLL